MGASRYNFLSAEQQEQETGGNSRADNARDVRTHCVHEQEVRRVGLASLNLRNARRHGNGGDACGADEGIDLALGDKIHELAEKHAACGREAECSQTEDDDEYGLLRQEGLTVRRCADGDAEHDGDDIGQSVLRGVAESFNNAALSEQVAEHEHADKRSDGGKHESADDKHDDGEDNLLCLADGSELLHLDRALFLRGEQLHDRGLNNRDKSHIRICRNGYGSEQVSCKL